MNAVDCLHGILLIFRHIFIGICNKAIYSGFFVWAVVKCWPRKLKLSNMIICFIIPMRMRIRLKQPTQNWARVSTVLGSIRLFSNLHSSANEFDAWITYLFRIVYPPLDVFLFVFQSSKIARHLYKLRSMYSPSPSPLLASERMQCKNHFHRFQFSSNRLTLWFFVSDEIIAEN